MAASFSTIAPPAGVLSNTEVSDRIGAIEISRIDGEVEAMLISAYGTNAKCSDVRYLVAIRGKTNVADISFL